MASGPPRQNTCGSTKDSDDGAQTAVPGRGETAAYFLALDLRLRVTGDYNGDGWDERWSLQASSGDTYWLANASDASSLDELWTRWWWMQKVFDAHHACVDAFAARYQTLEAPEAARVREWQAANEAAAKGQLSRVSRRSSVWPWRACRVDDGGSALRFSGWPWQALPLAGPHGAMPPPGTWMTEAADAARFDPAFPARYMQTLGVALVQAERQRLDEASPQAAAGRASVRRL